jgi:hypothetical protein
MTVLYISYILADMQHNGDVSLEKLNDYSIMGICRDIYYV